MLRFLRGRVRSKYFVRLGAASEKVDSTLLCFRFLSGEVEPEGTGGEENWMEDDDGGNGMAAGLEASESVAAERNSGAGPHLLYCVPSWS